MFNGDKWPNWEEILQNFYVTSARRRKNLRGTTNEEDPVVWSTIDKNSLKGVDELKLKKSSCPVREAQSSSQRI